MTEGYGIAMWLLELLRTCLIFFSTTGLGIACFIFFMIYCVFLVFWRLVE